MKILITGANGFIGKNLRVALERMPDLTILAFDVEDPPELLREYLPQADAIRFPLKAKIGKLYCWSTGTDFMDGHRKAFCLSTNHASGVIDG